MLTVSAAGSYGASTSRLAGKDLQPSGSRLAVQDRDRAEVGVRADPELAGLGWPTTLIGGLVV